MECCVTVVKFSYKYLLRIKVNVDVRRSIIYEDDILSRLGLDKISSSYMLLA